MTTETAGAGVRTDEESPFCYGRVIIEWPGPQREKFALAGWMCAVYDAVTGKPVTTVMRARLPSVVVHADAQDMITADLTMLADDKGMPILFPEEHHAGDDGKIREGTFPFFVAEMRVRS